MAHSTLTPVFVGLRTGLHVLFAALLTLVVVRLLVVRDDTMWAALALAAGFAVLYVLGTRVAAVRESRRVAAGAAWIIGLTAVWAVLLVLVPEAAYLVFPLFFLYLRVLPRIVGPAAVIIATLIAVLALGLHGGFTVGGVIGPLVGAGVALLIGLGYRALARDAVEREALVAELLATRDRLAATERQQGVLTERARLAREIHDTVAQGLSSIQMLLHAAEAADGPWPLIVDTVSVRLCRFRERSGARGFVGVRADVADRGVAPASVVAVRPPEHGPVGGGLVREFALERGVEAFRE